MFFLHRSKRPKNRKSMAQGQFQSHCWINFHVFCTLGALWLTVGLLWSPFGSLLLQFPHLRSLSALEFVFLHNFDESRYSITLFEKNAPSPKDSLPLQSILTHLARSGTLAVPAWIRSGPGGAQGVLECVAVLLISTSPFTHHPR